MRNRTTPCFIVILLFTFIIQIRSQTGLIEAKISDVQDSLIEGEAILLSADNNNLIRLVAFRQSRLKIDSLVNGSYFLKLLSVSHNDTTLFLKLSAEEPKIDLGTLRLRRSNTLQEISVNAKISTFEKTAEGTKVNIENTKVVVLLLF